MLVNLPAEWHGTRSPIGRLLTDTFEYDYSPKHLAKGVYLTHLNWKFDIQEWITDEYPFDPFMKLPPDTPTDDRIELFNSIDWDKKVQDYGVCDNWQQILEQWPEIESDPRSFIISLAEMRREDQPASGGWRWHKWGTYIGTQKPEHEYLYDDKHIDSVFCFHIYEVSV